MKSLLMVLDWSYVGQLTVPNDVNSHPHYSNSGDLVIIHNGIIENYDTIKKELIKRGYQFHSDTDTEVLVNLIEDVQLKEGVKLGKADCDCVKPNGRRLCYCSF